MNLDALSINDVIDIIKNCDDEHIQILPREKNEEFMFGNNITQTEAKEFIRTLTVDDLDYGPVEDKNPERHSLDLCWTENGPRSIPGRQQRISRSIPAAFSVCSPAAPRTVIQSIPSDGCISITAARQTAIRSTQGEPCLFPAAPRTAIR